MQGVAIILYVVHMLVPAGKQVDVSVDHRAEIVVVYMETSQQHAHTDSTHDQVLS